MKSEKKKRGEISLCKGLLRSWLSPLIAAAAYLPFADWAEFGEIASAVTACGLSGTAGAVALAVSAKRTSPPIAVCCSIGARFGSGALLLLISIFIEFIEFVNFALFFGVLYLLNLFVETVALARFRGNDNGEKKEIPGHREVRS